MRILLAGGGTGGHFFPLIALAREIRVIAEKNLIVDLDLYYLGALDQEKSQTLKKEGLIEIKVLTGKWRRYFSLENFLDIFKFFLGILQSLWHFFVIMPDVVFSKGGYGALPAVIGAVIFRIPLMVHESDAIPGKVNQWSARFADKVGVAFAGAADFFPKEKTALVGIPLRKKLLSGSPVSAKENLNITSGLPVLGFVGGSQGAQKINDALLGILKELAGEFEIIHQCGEKNLSDVKSEAEVILNPDLKNHYHLFGFMNEEEIRDFYAAADLIISRASSSIMEIAASGKPSILIPLSGAAQDHQRKNAYEYSRVGACLIVEETNLTPHVLLRDITKLISDKEKIKQMSDAAKNFARLDSAEIIAREILGLAVHNL
ncbi:MAG: UDP-N-acetylglucosamine--N-acetylmuramyl-(pentapeptide) pyrophosphoryl-undecaprenol N-acetylglucosamine transferase [bacterium]|nr:UDP-N-acetylglucosamine--N-acetylmuramyl-(pentapeptide) pyrophosphoryl-undecaprenol N-acetylglucosamine transferase [bacterium]